jgi:hypothetical protein
VTEPNQLVRSCRSHVNSRNSPDSTAFPKNAISTCDCPRAASYLSAKTTAGAVFQIMCVSAEIDLLVNGGDDPHVRKATERRIERLHYRSLDGLRPEASEFPNARAYMMSQGLDPKLKTN